MASTRITVGMITPRYAPAIGGVERCVEILARGLAQRGVEVEVITTDPSGILPPLEEREGVLVRRFATIGQEAYFIAPRLGRWLLQNAHRYTLLHAHSYHTPLALQAAVASRLRGVPLVVTPYYHGTGHSFVRKALHGPYRPLGRWMLHQACQVICISSAERSLLHHHFGPRLPTTVIPVAADVENIRTAEPFETSSPRVLTLAVGRLDPYKQISLLVEALPYLPISFELAIIGEGPARRQIEQSAVRLEVEKRVHLLGHVTQHELHRWYRTANVYATLSRQESFGLTLLESAVAGCAVLASDIPPHREVASYLAEQRVHFLTPDCRPDQVASGMWEAARLGKASDTEDWPLPTWSSAIDNAYSSYQRVMSATLT